MENLLNIFVIYIPNDLNILLNQIGLVKFSSNWVYINKKSLNEHHVFEILVL